MEVKMKKLSIVVSVYNEELVIEKFYNAFSEVSPELSCDWELLFVNDGSSDSSFEYLTRFAAYDVRVKAINFSRNYGHEAAMIAGIDYAMGDGIVCMDADLQHPVECLPEMVEKFEEGFDVITMVRTENASAGLLKNVASSSFYRVINALSDRVSFQENASDFFGISSRVADVLRTSYREKSRFLRGYIQGMGFRSTKLEYRAAPRGGGSSHYGLGGLFRLSAGAIVGFSSKPLRLGVSVGFLSALLGFVVLVYTLLTREGAPSGYATIIVTMCFLFAALFLVIGIIGEYLAVLFSEIKDRPIYLVDSTINFDGDN